MTNRYILGYYVRHREDAEVLHKETNWKILRHLRKSTPLGLTEKEIAKDTRMSEKTVNAQVNELIDKGFAAETRETTRKRGQGRTHKARRIFYEDEFYPFQPEITEKFLEVLHEVADDPLWDDISDKLLGFAERVHDALRNSSTEDVKKWLPIEDAGPICLGCHLSHESQEFVRAILLHVCDHAMGYRAGEWKSTQKFAEFMDKYKWLDNKGLETYQKLLKADEGEFEEEEEE